MKEKTLYPLWVCMYVLCVFLGAIPERSGAGAVALAVVGLLFFVPGAALLYLGFRKDRKKTVRTVRRISILSLALTTLALVANLLSIRSASLLLGDVLHVVLLAVSSPMLCFENWVVSLFLWACLLVVTFPGVWRGKQKKK